MGGFFGGGPSIPEAPKPAPTPAEPVKPDPNIKKGAILKSKMAGKARANTLFGGDLSGLADTAKKALLGQ